MTTDTDTKPSTILVTGATGLLGRQVVKAFQQTGGWQVVGTGFTRADPPAIIKLDLGDEQAIERVMDEVRPDVVVHCAANRFPDACMSDPDGTRALNVQATSTLALACAQRSAVLIYISSDYVFPGLRGEAPYSASATPRPPNFYGETKLAGEQAVLSSSIGGGGGGGGGGIVLRVPVLYGEVTAPEESAINVLLEAVWKSQTEDYQVEMDDWAIRYPTNTEDVARVIRDLARRYLDAQRGQQQQQQQQQTTLPRIVQFSAEEPYTKYQICLILGEIMGFSMDNMKPIKPDDDDDDEKEVSVKRPYDCHLSTKELKDIGVNIQAMDFKSWWRRNVRAYRR